MKIISARIGAIEMYISIIAADSRAGYPVQTPAVAVEFLESQLFKNTF